MRRGARWIQWGGALRLGHKIIRLHLRVRSVRQLPTIRLLKIKKARHDPKTRPATSLTLATFRKGNGARLPETQYGSLGRRGASHTSDVCETLCRQLLAIARSFAVYADIDQVFPASGIADVGER